MSLRNKETDKQAKGQSLSRVLLLILVLILASGLVLVARKLDLRMNQEGIDRDDFSGDNSTSYAKGSVELYGSRYDYDHTFDNYLFMGTDGSGNEDETGEAHQNSMADFLLLMSIDRTDNSYTLLELDRNTITEIHMITDDGADPASALQQLCTAHWYGGTTEMGCSNQVRAVSDMLGDLPINGYFSITMDDIPALNHAIGGVTVTMRDDLTAVDPAFTKGAEVTLTDDQAEKFLRARMNVTSGSNRDRMQRQTDYLNAFLNQSTSKVGKNGKYFYNVFDTIEKLSVTDMTGKQFSRVAKAMTENTFRGLVTFEGESKEGTALDDGLVHEEFYPDEESVVEVMTAIFSLQQVDEETETEDYGESEIDTWEDWVVEYGTEADTEGEWTDETESEAKAEDSGGETESEADTETEAETVLVSGKAGIAVTEHER